MIKFSGFENIHKNNFDAFNKVPKTIKRKQLDKNVIKDNEKTKNTKKIYFEYKKERKLDGLTRRETEMVKYFQKSEIDSLEEAELECLELGVYSTDELIRQSVVCIDSHQIEGFGTVNDERMGTTDREKLCKTCFKSMCEGHMGYIKLYKLLIHPFYIKFVADMLNCLCPGCASLLCTEDTIYQQEFNLIQNRLNRITAISKYCKKVAIKCHRHENCIDYPPREYKSDDKTYSIDYTMKFDKKKDAKRYPIEVEDILRLFKMLECRYPDDVKLLGFKGLQKPSNFILEVFPVIPPSCRPPVKDEAISRLDKLTRVLSNLVKVNNKLGDEIAKKESEDKKNKISELYKELKYKTGHIFSNPDKNQNKSRQNPVEGIICKLKGKEGKIRGNLMGKRVIQTARTVADPHTDEIDIITVPICMRSVLSQLFTINKYNKGFFQNELQEGRIKNIYPGRGKFVNKKFKINNKIRNEYKLKFGDKIDSWLQEDAEALFNRQPTLHYLSMLGARVKFDKNPQSKVIRTHLSVQKCINGDFDGDETNLHILQSAGAKAEALTICNVNNNLINKASSRVIIAPHFDSLFAIYNITETFTLLKPTEFYDLLNESYKTFEGYIKGYNFESVLERHKNKMNKYKIALFSGKSIFSLLLPDGFFYKNSEVEIVDGVLINGVISSKSSGTSHRSIIQVLKHQGFDPVLFMNRCSKMMNRFFLYYPETIGLRDCITLENKKFKEFKSRELEKMKIDIIKVNFKYNIDGDKSACLQKLDESEIEQRDKEIVEIIRQTCSNIASEVSKQLDIRNNFMRSAKSGIKGTEFNIEQVCCQVGQQYFNGLLSKIKLAFYKSDDPNPGRRGFIFKNLVDGLSPSEYFMYLASTRIPLLDTSTKTSDTGGMQRILVKMFESIVVDKKGFVRNSNGKIVQFLYGYDNLNTYELISCGNTVTPIDIYNEITRINFQYGYC